MLYTNNVKIHKEHSAQSIFDTYIKLIASDDINNFLKFKKHIPYIIELKNFEEDGLTLLHYAVIFKKLQIAEILIEEFGADINSIDDKDGQAPVHIAAANNHLDMLELLIKNKASLNVCDKSNKTALYTAIYYNFLPGVKLLIDSGADIYIDAENNNTYFSPLHVAVGLGNHEIVLYMLSSGVDANGAPSFKHYDTSPLNLALLEKKLFIAEILIMYGASLNYIDKNFNIPLYIAITENYRELILLMISKGANPYIKLGNGLTIIENVSLYHLSIFPLLLEHSEKLFYEALSDKNTDLANKLLSKNKFNLELLKAIFFINVRQHNFNIASLIINHDAGLNSFYKLKDISNSDRNINISYLYNIIKADLSEIFYSSDLYNKEDLLNVITQIRILFFNIPKSIELLKPIDDELKEFEENSNLNFSKLKVDSYIISNSLAWPPAPPQEFKPNNKMSALRGIMRKYLQHHGIELQDELYIFAGFIDSKIADEIVKTGKLFKEQFLLGNSIIHGLYSHYFQWLIIALAIESKYIILPKNMTLSNILTSFIELTIIDKSIWTLMIDQLDHNISHNSLQPYLYNLSSPHEINSFLLNNRDLPYIRGYLLDSWYKNIEKFQQVYKAKFNIDIPYEIIIEGQAFAYDIFDKFNLLDMQDVISYYQNNSKTSVNIDEKTCIITKPKWQDRIKRNTESLSR